MFAHAEAVDAQFVGQDGFVDDVPEDLGMTQHRPIGALGHIAEGVQPQMEGIIHCVGWLSSNRINSSTLRAAELQEVSRQ